MRRKTIIIFGVSSFIGSNLAESLKDEYRVIGTYFETPVKISGIQTIPCDVLSRDEVQLIVYNYKPDYSIYCSGLKSNQLCQEFPKMADALNTVGLFNVTEVSERYKAKTCLISSAKVFNGEDRDFQENDNPDPNTIYGKTKVSAEFYLQKSCLNYVIFRCCNFYGRSINARQKTFFEMLEDKVSNDQPASYDNKIKEGWLDVDFLGMFMKLSFKKNVTNRLFQITSKGTMTHYDFAKSYCKIFDGNETLLQKGSWPFSPLDGYAGSSGGLSYQMDLFNCESFFGVEMPTVEESLMYTYQRFGGAQGKKKSASQEGSVKFI